MEKIIIAYFKDKYGNEEQVKILIAAVDENDFKVRAEDEATVWYYDIAIKFFSHIWKNSNYDYNYDSGFNDYLENCTLTWEILE